MLLQAAAFYSLIFFGFLLMVLAVITPVISIYTFSKLKQKFQKWNAIARILITVIVDVLIDYLVTVILFKTTLGRMHFVD